MSLYWSLLAADVLVLPAALREELLIVAAVLPLARTNLRAEPAEEVSEPAEAPRVVAKRFLSPMSGWEPGGRGAHGRGVRHAGKDGGSADEALGLFREASEQGAVGAALLLAAAHSAEKFAEAAFATAVLEAPFQFARVDVAAALIRLAHIIIITHPHKHQHHH